MRVMVLGVRGVGGVQGGVETHAEQLYPRLAELGCNVQILVRTPFSPKQQRYFGPVRLRRIWSPRTPGLEALLHSILGVIYAGIARPDLLHIHAIGPSIVTPLARMMGLSVVVTHHGPDYERDKWGWFARWVLRNGERAGMTGSQARIAISKVIAEAIRTKYGRSADVIPNGSVPAAPATGSDEIGKYALVPGRYFLQVSRIVPEKRQLDLIQAYGKANPADWKLVLVGGGSGDYLNRVRAAARETGAVLTGFQSGRALQQLYSNAGAFVLPSSHEGLPIAILEALSYGLPVLASEIPANLEIGTEVCNWFPVGDIPALAAQLTRMAGTPPDPRASEERQAWVAKNFDWDRIAAQTYAVYRRVADQKSRVRAGRTRET